MSKNLKEKVFFQALCFVQERKTLSVRHLMGQAGFAVGSFYNFYKNMDELVLTIKAYILDRLALEAKKELISKKDSLGKAISSVYIRFSKKYSAEWDFLFNETVKGDIPEWYQEKVDATFEVLERTILKTSSLNEIQAKEAAKVLWAGLHGITSLAQVGGGGILEVMPGVDAETLCQSLFYHYLRGFDSSI